MTIRTNQSIPMLSITKLGNNALSRLAKENEMGCRFRYRGYWNPNGVPYEAERPIMHTNKTLAKGHYCTCCNGPIKQTIYGWSWQDGLHVAKISQTSTIAEAIHDLLIAVPNLSHFGMWEEHSDSYQIFWVYRYDKSRL